MIRLDAGSMDFEQILLGDSAVHLEGSRGFVFDGYATLARLDAVDCYYPCDPVETVSIYATAVGNDLQGIASLDGREYVDVGGMSSLNQMRFEITGRFRIPRLGTRDEKTLTVRGKIAAVFCHEEIPLAQAVCEPIKGRVIATIGLYKYDGGWTVGEISYDVR
jgi:hypothetical protein